MGGQACVFYGAAEFSRDLDLLVLVEDEELDRLRAALADLNCEPVAVPTLSADYLRRGHAVHFRCTRSDVNGLRIDLMSHLRGLPSFEELWGRRTTFEVGDEKIDTLALEDLVLAKKTQLDKDWPMIRRLVEQSYLTRSSDPAPESVEFWLRELRTPTASRCRATGVCEPSRCRGGFARGCGRGYESARGRRTHGTPSGPRVLGASEARTGTASPGAAGVTRSALHYALRTVRRSMRFSYFSPWTMRWT